MAAKGKVPASVAQLFSFNLVVFICSFLFISAHCQKWNYNLKDYKDHPCNRPCQDNDLPRLCKYDFLVENYYVLSKACFNCPFNQTDCLRPQCVSGDGVRRGIKVVNRMMPGPAIQVCQGDEVEVTVENGMDSGEGTSIHWHGILQHGTPFMDGVSSLTQCPITYHTHFTYRFVANDVGTHFWHGHSGIQRSDGLYGPFIVRQPPSQEYHQAQYDFDLPEHVISISDWLTNMTTDRISKYVHFDYDNKARLMLINGMGKYQNFTDSYSRVFATPYSSFTVRPGQRYRFRLINAGIMNCALQFSIDSHKITVIASDGQPVQPFIADSLTIYSGERYDFVLNTITPIRTRPLRNYWIRVRGYGNCELYRAVQSAVLKYQGAPDVLPPERTTWWDAIRTGINLNPALVTPTGNNYEVTSLETTEPDDDILTVKPNRTYYMAIDFVQVENLRAHNPLLYPFENSTLKFYSPTINWISNMLPPSPPLTQLEDLPEELFVNAETVQKNCRKEWCAGVHLYEVPLNSVVEVVVVDEGILTHSYHPMHLHGHKFRVVGMGRLNETTTLEKVKELDARGQLNRSRSKAPIKDTVIVPDGGYTIFRFRADNPGFWLFHCHVEFHAETGMAMTFQVGTPSQHPPKPKNFPTCGHWKFTGFEETTKPK